MTTKPSFAGRQSAHSPAESHNAADPALDLTSCDREPIHIPGSIQPHGFLLALHPHSLEVECASENAVGYLHRPLAGIFGQQLPQLFGAPLGEALVAALRGPQPAGTPRLIQTVTLPSENGLAQPTFEVVAHQAESERGSRVVLEFERVFEEADAGAINTRLFNFLSGKGSRQSIDAVLQAAVEELRALTGCDRVVLYRFDEEGHGVVLAEDRDAAFASYLGLHFPASDVPLQARRMYERNRVRIIPDVDYEPSPLISAEGPVHQFDLSSSILRSVSPVHRAYMRNMGTRCSMSVSILVQGKLWGLVSCHHHQPRYVPLRLRAACDMVMQVVSSQLEAQAAAEHLRRVLHTQGVQRELLAAMAAQEDHVNGLLESPALLQQLLGADGVAVVAENTAHLFGTTPGKEQVLHLSEWLQGEPSLRSVFSSSHLSELYPPAAHFSSAASGVVAVQLSRIHSVHVLWFRRERIATVRWAGDPQKPALPADATPLAPGVTIHPRHSFAEWAEIVRGRSLPWTPEEITAASELRAAVLEIVLKRAEELAELAAGLKIANAELEAFSYSVSHDLRAPFRHILGFSEMLREEEADRMSERGQRYLRTIMESAQFAGLLVDSLLDFSRIGRTQLIMASVAMESVVDGEWAAVLEDEGGSRQIRFARGPLPIVEGDPYLLRQVVRNLLSNAIKYTGKVEEAIIKVGAQQRNGEWIFFIKDNGAGFDPKYAGKLFGVFQRLHRAEDFPGTGIGLANVRRIVERHGGRTWAEAEVGQGATFFFSMPAAPAGKGD